MIKTPYSTLTPDCVINSLDNIGLYSDGRLLSLNSYENRVYQIGMEEGPTLVAKFYRPGRWSDAAILEEHEFLQQLAEAELPVVPAMTINNKTLHEFAGFRFSVFSRQGGHAPEFDHSSLERMGRLIARIHATGALKPFRHRDSLTVEKFGMEARLYLLSNQFIPNDLTEAYGNASEQALLKAQQCFKRAAPLKSLRLHGDCYAGNVLWTESGPHFVDFDDSRMGPAIQDLWMLLSGSREEMSIQLKHLLEGYDCFYHFDAKEIHLIEALRTLRLIHYSAWLAKRWNDPAFPLAFPWFNTHRYWQERIMELQEQIALMDEPPLSAY